MSNFTDKELVVKVREELYMGCVVAAKDWSGGIQEYALRRDMLELIRDYELTGL